MTGSNGNIARDPVFADPSGGDFHLSGAGSPAVDAGTNLAPFLPTTDIDGDPRILDGNGDGILVVDMGADELSAVGLLTVAIDIKPGSSPNSINPRSGGVTTVAILSSPELNAPSDVLPTSLTFGKTGDEQSLAFCNKSPEDVKGDGFQDLICHFFTDRTGFELGDTRGTVKGFTLGGRRFRGSDSVNIVP